jgi:hypothetical protein
MVSELQCQNKKKLTTNLKLILNRGHERLLLIIIKP